MNPVRDPGMNIRNKLKPSIYSRLVISNGVKKFLFIALVTVFAVAPHALAVASQTSFVPLAPIPGLTDTSALSIAKETNLASFFNNLYKYLVGLAAVLAVIMIIWGGLEYSTQDSVSKKSDGKERIYQAIFGLVLVLSPVLVFSIINPSILNLSINFDPLKTVSGTTPPGSGPGPGTIFCSGQIVTNCTPLPPSAGGSVPMRVPGWWCYEIAAGGYWCAETRTACFNYLTTEGEPNAPKPGITDCTQTPGTPLPPPISTPTECTLSGTPGLLQFAICPTIAAAQAWGQSCTENLSEIRPLTVGAGGGTATNIITCSTKKEYVFIETIGVLSPTRAVNRLQPLAVTSSNPNNASEVMSFVNICNQANLERATCISDLPQTTFATECQPRPTTQIPSSSGGSGKCYKETLSCINSTLSARCAAPPSWAPFQ